MHSGAVCPPKSQVDGKLEAANPSAAATTTLIGKPLGTFRADGEYAEAGFVKAFTEPEHIGPPALRTNRPFGQRCRDRTRLRRRRGGGAPSAYQPSGLPGQC